MKSFEARDRLILAEGGQQVRKFMPGNIELAHSFGQRHEYRMFGSAFITGVEFALPLIEQGQRGIFVSDFISQIV